jgi:DHA2 family multidrug resistance protein
MSTAIATATADVDARATNKLMIAVAVSLGALLEVVDSSIVNVALTEMQNALGATVSGVGWVVSSYAVANVIILPLTAWLGLRFGRKRYFVTSLVLFTISSVLCGMATSLPILILARVLQGLGGGGLLAKAQAILFETFPKEEQAMAQGLFGAIVIAGPAIGPTLGGYLVTNVGWRWIFFVNIPIGIAAVFMCMAFLPADEEQTTTDAIDWASLGFLVVGLGALQTVLEEGQNEDWFDSPLITSFTLLAAIGLGAFIWRQLTSKRPIVDLRVLRHRSLWAGSLISFMLGVTLYGALFSVPIFASSVMGYSSQQTGMLLLPSALASAVMMPVAAKLVGKIDPRALLALGALVLLASVMALGRVTPATGEPQLLWPLIGRAVGTVLMFLPLSMATLGPIPNHEMQNASGFYNLTRQLGGSVGVAMLTTLLARRQAFHRNMLVESVSAIAPDVTARLAAASARFVGDGFSLEDARQKAIAILDGGVNLQAAVMSFGDTFSATAALIIVSLPLVLLLGKADPGAKLDAGH